MKGGSFCHWSAASCAFAGLLSQGRHGAPIQKSEGWKHFKMSHEEPAAATSAVSLKERDMEACETPIARQSRDKEVPHVAAHASHLQKHRPSIKQFEHKKPWVAHPACRKLLQLQPARRPKSSHRSISFLP